MIYIRKEVKIQSKFGGAILIKTIQTDLAPEAIGPYSQAKMVGDFLYMSGQIPLDPKTGEMVGENVSAQTAQVLKNISAVLEEAGLSESNVVKTTCFLADIADFANFNEEYASFFTSKPARSCVAAKDLPKGALVEIEVIAYKGE